jgi:hypothetical protein
MIQEPPPALTEKYNGNAIVVIDSSLFPHQDPGLQKSAQHHPCKKAIVESGKNENLGAPLKPR